MKKKIIYNEKRIFFGAEILKGYCLVCIVTERLGSRRAQGRWRACWGARRGAGELAGARAGRAWGSQVAAGRWASGLAVGARGARQERQARARQADAGQARGERRQREAGALTGTAWPRMGARLGTRCARGTAGLGVAWALDGCTGWASFGALCTWLSSGSVFGPGLTRYFPESQNEHCSL